MGSPPAELVCRRRKTGRELCALFPTECVPLQTNNPNPSGAHTNISTSRQHAGSTPTPPEHRPVWRDAGGARPTCAPSACVRETLFLDYWKHEPQARYRGFMDQVGVVVLLLRWSKRGLHGQVRTRGASVEVCHGSG